MNLVISKMTISDLNSIADNLSSDFDDFWNLQIFKNELVNNNSYYLVAKINDEIVGFGGIWQAFDTIHITNIVTKKNNRNKGIASLILEKLIEIAKKRDINNITLEVRKSNIPAFNLYSKYNFENIGIRKNYYGGIEDAIIMTLVLHK